LDTHVHISHILILIVILW